MNDLMMQHRINDILQQKVAMGAGMDDDYGMGVALGGYRRRRRRAPVRRRRVSRRRGGVLIGGDDFGDDYGDGVLIGGYRRRHKRRPSEWNLAVGDYVRRHGGTVAEAAHALKRSHRSRPKRRVSRRRGGVVPTAGYGGARSSRAYLSKAEELALEKQRKKAYQKLACDPAAFKHAAQRGKLSQAEFNRRLRECGLDPLQARRKGLDMELRALADRGATEYLKDRPSYATLFP